MAVRAKEAHLPFVHSNPSVNVKLVYASNQEYTVCCTLNAFTFIRIQHQSKDKEKTTTHSHLIQLLFYLSDTRLCIGLCLRFKRNKKKLI